MTVAPVVTKKRTRIMACHYRGEEPCKNAPVVCCVSDDAPGLGFLCSEHQHQESCCAFKIGGAS